MNKKGITLGLRFIIVGVALLVVLAFVLWISSDRLKAAYEDIKKAQALARAQLEELRKAKAPEVKEMETETGIMLQLLADAAENVKNEKYSDAIKKYRMYYEGCEKEATEEYERRKKAGLKVTEKNWVGISCGAIKKDGIKFRILSALRNKYFLTPKQPIDQNDIKIVSEELITPEEFNCAMTLVKLAAYTKSDILDEAKLHWESYYKNLKCSEKKILLDIDGNYYTVIEAYFYVKHYTKQLGKDAPNVKNWCEVALESNNKPVEYANNFLKAFETVPEEPRASKTDFSVSNYEFLKVPHGDIEEIC